MNVSTIREMPILVAKYSSWKVVYKDGTGCAVVQHEEGTMDSDNPKEYVGNDELLWIQFGN